MEERDESLGEAVEEENSRERRREGHWNAQKQIKIVWIFNRDGWCLFYLNFFLFFQSVFWRFSGDRKKKENGGWEEEEEAMVNGCDSLN